MSEAPQSVTGVSPRLPRRRSWRWVLWALALTLATGEGVARVFVASPSSALRLSTDRQLRYELAPGQHRSDGNLFRIAEYTVSIDQHGCRTGARPDGVDGRTVLFVGDSFTYGDGVDHDAVYTEQLQGIFATHTDPNWGAVEPVNCAVPGYNLTQIARSVERQLAAVAPDLLVVALFSNDLREATPLDDFLDRSSLFDSLFTHSRLVRGVYTASLVFSGALDPPYLPVEVIDAALAQIEEAANERGVPLAAVVLEEPVHPELDLAAVLRERGWRVAVAPDLSGEVYRIPRNGHFNARGHREVAEWLAPQLESVLNSGEGAP